MAPRTRKLLLLLAASCSSYGLVACDPGKKQFTIAQRTEETGNFEAAIQQYQLTCTQHPDSESCGLAIVRQGELRLELARRAIAARQFTQAKNHLDTVIGAKDEKTKKEAEALLASADMELGLTWEKYKLQIMSKDALAAMERVATSSTAAAPSAKEWLAQHRPRLMFQEIAAACGTPPAETCPALVSQLREKHPDANETTQAQRLLEAWQQRRLAEQRQRKAFEQMADSMIVGWDAAIEAKNPRAPILPMFWAQKQQMSQNPVMKEAMKRLDSWWNDRQEDLLEHDERALANMFSKKTKRNAAEVDRYLKTMLGMLSENKDLHEKYSSLIEAAQTTGAQLKRRRVKRAKEHASCMSVFENAGRRYPGRPFEYLGGRLAQALYFDLKVGKRPNGDPARSMHELCEEARLLTCAYQSGMSDRMGRSVSQSVAADTLAGQAGAQTQLHLLTSGPFTLRQPPPGDQPAVTNRGKAFLAGCGIK